MAKKGSLLALEYVKIVMLPTEGGKDDDPSQERCYIITPKGREALARMRVDGAPPP